MILKLVASSYDDEVVLAMVLQLVAVLCIQQIIDQLGKYEIKFKSVEENSTTFLIKSKYVFCA